MILQRFVLVISLCAISYVMSPNSASAEKVSESWVDFNYVPCEGIGVHGTGRVKATAEITRTSSGFTLHTLRITATHSNISGFSASIEFKDDASRSQKVRLVRPWYSTIGAAGETSLVMPRNKTSLSSGPSEQMEVNVGGDEIKVKANFLFSLDGGNCAAAFEEIWRP